MAFEEALIQGAIQGGTSAVVSLFILNYVLKRLDIISEDTTAILTCLKLKKKK